VSDRPFCASSPEAQLLSDEDFWAAVYPQPEDRDEPDVDDCPDWVIGQCLRCQSGIRVEGYEEAMERRDEWFCDDCADEMADELEEVR
jgi:hypothetical protein